jgi:hypothetical protein
VESEYAVVDDLWLRVREDPYRVRYPVYNSCDSCVPMKDLSIIKKIREFCIGVHLVRVNSNHYVYKEVDRPLYMPNDSKALEIELRNLERIHRNKGIVQLITVVVSHNPYRTAKAVGYDPPTTLQGILLEYHPNGMLKDMLQSPKPTYRDHLFTLGSSSGSYSAYRSKAREYRPSREIHTILIDISGSGGTTRKWLSPEIQSIPEPLSQDIEAQKQNNTVFGP